MSTLPERKDVMNLYPKTEALTDECRFGTIPIADDLIHLVEMSNSRREHVEAWINHSCEIRRQASPEKPLMVLADMSEANFAFTPYSMQRGTEMMQIREGQIKTYISWVIERSVLGHMVENVITLANGRGGNYYNVAYSREEASKWLTAMHTRFYEEKNASDHFKR